MGLKGKVRRQVSDGDMLKVWRTHEGSIAADKGWSSLFGGMTGFLYLLTAKKFMPRTRQNNNIIYTENTQTDVQSHT